MKKQNTKRRHAHQPQRVDRQLIIVTTSDESAKEAATEIINSGNAFITINPLAILNDLERQMGLSAPTGEIAELRKRTPSAMFLVSLKPATGDTVSHA